ncbi:replicative DNA helicase [Marinisporobacter balticus]|uniref:Replicative DNA helicase n=1 Tax=Marinisporobacter balticus TaxID=2018667 RepID=A0A4R2K841_9FIRM|nr:replicative DNA helicase [Marinisporobacter balticus]TCO69541.1 replicative DNA helicase [Marinisporobacter balticus]
MIQNLNLEQSILSCMIQDYNCAKEGFILTENDFVSNTHKAIFEAIKEMVQDNKQIDHLTLAEHMNQKINITELIALSNAEPTTTNFLNYMKQLKGVTNRRSYYYLAQEIMEKAKAGEDVSEFTEQEVFKLNETVESAEFTETKDIVFEVLDGIEERYKINGISGVTTGYKALDRMTDGLQKQDLIYLAARPSMGKTALAVNIGQNAAEKGNKVAIFSFEMSKEALIKRMVMSEAIVSDEKIRGKSMGDNDWGRLAKATNILYRRNIFISDKANSTVAEMKSMARKLKRRKGLDLIIIDYLQMVRAIEGSSRREQVESISRNLKNLAKEIDVPVIVISSLSRANTQRSNNKPILSDLRETGQIEYDADIVMFIHREEYYDPSSENRGEAEIIIAKQRNGPVGIVKLGWVAPCTKFIDYESLEKHRRS